jgi:hypothetical protein
MGFLPGDGEVLWRGNDPAQHSTEIWQVSHVEHEGAPFSHWPLGPGMTICSVVLFVSSIKGCAWARASVLVSSRRWGGGWNTKGKNETSVICPCQQPLNTHWALLPSQSSLQHVTDTAYCLKRAVPFDVFPSCSQKPHLFREQMQCGRLIWEQRPYVSHIG